jgi:hypothetical protein
MCRIRWRRTSRTASRKVIVLWAVWVLVLNLTSALDGLANSSGTVDFQSITLHIWNDEKLHKAYVVNKLYEGQALST